MKAFKDNNLQVVIGQLLRIGVIVSMAIVITGLMLFLAQYGRQIVNYQSFNESAVFDLRDFYNRLCHFESTAIMDLGVMALIATPIARILFTFVGFWREKDRLYMLIAFLVLCVMLFSVLYEIGE